MARPTTHIFKKEIREMMRDRRVLTSAIIGPIFLIVVMLVLFGYLDDSLSKPKKQTVHVVASARSAPLVQALAGSGAFNVAWVPTRAQGESLVRDGKAKLLLDVESADDVKDKGPTTLLAYFNPDEPLAGIPLQVVEECIGATNKAVVGAILKSRGIPAEMAEPNRLEKKPLKTTQGLGGTMIIGMIPYLIVIWAFYGGISVVTELVTGEKEKSTLETLLITPALRTQIAFGKYFALCCVCLTSSLMSLIGLIIVGLLRLPLTKGLFPHGISVSAPMLIGVAAALLPLVALFASVLLSISTFARNTREAQTHLTLVSFLVLMPAIFSQFIGLTDFAHAKWIPFVPILNSALCIKDALMGKTDWSALAITVGISMVLAAVGIRWAVWMFNREQVLTRV
jgi:sodium transport system permease protein